MSQADRIKEEIGWLKVVFGILVATDLSLLAWLAQNLGGVGLVLVVIAVIAIIAVTVAVVWINRTAYVRIEQLENL